MGANIYTSSKMDSIIQMEIGDLLNEVEITNDKSIYSMVMAAYDDNKSMLCVKKKSGYSYIIPKNSIQYIQVIEE